VRVEDDRARSARHVPLAEDGGRNLRARAFQEAWPESARAHHLDDERGVAAYVLAIRGDVRNREQADELREDAVLVGTPVAADRADRLRPRGHGSNSRGQDDKLERQRRAG
jgi:hypothetical protein